MKKIVVIWGILCLAPGAFAATGSRLSLAPLTRELSDGYRAKAGEKKSRLAILDVGAGEELTRDGIPALLNEMFTQEFVKRPEFVVLERDLFAKVLEEHKLQANFGDTETAVKMGRVLGAQVVLIGRADRIGDQIRVSGRLVNTETTEILSAAVQDIPSKEFNRRVRAAEEEGPALNRGFALSAVYSFQAKGSNAFLSHTEGSLTKTLHTEPPSPNWIGAQLSYYFLKDIFGAVSYQVEARRQALGQVFYQDGSLPPMAHDMNARGHLWRAGMGADKHLGPRWSASLSAGVSSISYDMGVESELKKTMPYAGGGFTFRLQPTLDIGIHMTYDFGSLKGMWGGTGLTAFKLNPFMVSPTLTFRF